MQLKRFVPRQVTFDRLGFHGHDAAISEEWEIEIRPLPGLFAGDGHQPRGERFIQPDR